MVHDTDIVELEIKSKKFALTVRKKEALQVPEPIIQMVSAPQQLAAPASAPQAAAGPAPAAPAPPRPAAPAAAAAPPAIDGIEVASPMSGTFYHCPAPGEPPFCREGDRVKKGQTVGIIEAMKLMNEIEAEVSGVVVKFLADNGTAVSPGQPLLIIKP